MKALLNKFVSISAVISLFLTGCSKNSDIPVSSISIDKTEMVMSVGESGNLTVTVSPSDAKEKFVTWSSSDSYVATVSSSGLVKAIAPGTATVTASCGGFSATCKVSVKVPVTSISLDESNITLGTGKTQQLTATVSPETATDKTVTWASSNASSVTVSSTGMVTAVAAGSATITASCGGYSAACQVTVYTSVSSITLNTDKLSVSAGDSRQLTATISPDNATYKTITWKSSNYDIAQVSQSGRVNSIAPGEVTITASCDGHTAQCVVTVVDVVDLGLSVKWAAVNLGAKSIYENGDFYAWGELSTKTDYSWAKYKWCEGDPEKLKKYNYDPDMGTVDSLYTLELSDDVAHEKLGGSWRMPTQKEVQELMAKCTWTYREAGGAKGFQVTGPNGNSMFIPFNGYRYETGGDGVGQYGFYWSSTVDDFTPYYSAYMLIRKDGQDLDFLYRCGGFGIRAVCN